MPSNEATDPYMFAGNSDKVTFGLFDSAPTGWICPQCRNGIAPVVTICPVCADGNEAAAALAVRKGGTCLGGVPIMPVDVDRPETADDAADAEDRIIPVNGEATIRLPAGFAADPDGFPMQQLANLDGEWRDVFPGQLQARIQQPLLAARIEEPVAVIFRLTPKE